MQTLTQEQFKAKYGEQTLSKFSEIDSARFGGANSVTQPQESSKPISNKITDFLGLGGATKVFGDTLARAGFGGQNAGQKEVSQLTGMSQKEINQANIDKPTAGQLTGAALQTATIPAGFALTGGTSVLGQAAVGAGIGYAYDVGQDLVNKKSAKEVVTPGVGTLVGGAGPVAIRGASSAVGALKKPATKALNAVAGTVTNTIPDSTMAQGAKQTATDLVERVPRFVGRVNEAVREQAVKSQRIKTSTPAVAQAIKVDLPESLVQTVPKATPEAKAAFKKVLDIAEAPKTTLGQKSNPAIVGGDLASKQYDVIEKQRKTIGNAIGEKVKQLGLDKAKADMRPAFSQVDSVLSEQGITVSKNGKLSFAGKFTPQERTRMQELYTLSKESGDVLTPLQVRDMDVLFSKLQRESRMEGVGDILIDVNGEKMSMFRVFRDIYSNQLENLSPELRVLNSQYRNVSTLIDDIENSIFKTPNFNVTKSTDQAEFAKVNLRRIFGESQSSPAYEAIADEMDAISRSLGYADASPKEVAAFAQEIRQLYPETVPKTGFQGGIKGALDMAQQVLGAGKADTRDQQKALRALLDATE